MTKLKESKESKENDRTPEVPVRDRETVPRLSVTLTDDGMAFAWDRMHERTRDQLRTLIARDPGRASGPAAIVMPVAALGGLVDAWAQLTVLLARAVVTSATQDQAVATMTYSASEKEIVTPLLADVLSQYPAIFGQWQKEISLALVVSTITASKLQALRLISLGPSRVVVLPSRMPPEE